MIDTHTHLDGEEFREDLQSVVLRAQDAGITKMFVPAIDLKSSVMSMDLARSYPHVLYSMAGLHPEEVNAGFKEQLGEISSLIAADRESFSIDKDPHRHYIAIGEVGLDFYWSREFEHEQLEAFETQVQWSVQTRLPLMIHCRKAQNEMVRILRRYEKELPGGVFHCFTGNEKEAAELLQFSGFALGIGGVLTFKSSHLPEVLPSAVPLDRIVLETDSPYMAPVPFRGKRNESAYIKNICLKLADAYGVLSQEISEITDSTALRIFCLDR